MLCEPVSMRLAEHRNNVLPKEHKKRTYFDANFVVKNGS
jgi:hypothetical protein